MNPIYIDFHVDDDLRRQRIHGGQVFVSTPRPSTVALCEFARQMLQDAFAPLDPREAQHSLAVEDFVAIAARVKPHFIHHPKAKILLRAVVEEFGCDLTKTYFDVPRIKVITHGGYLTAGIGYVYHPHRDTWYSAPACQINWWLPVYDIESDSSMAFHPKYWTKPVRNGSSEFNYYEYNGEGRRNAAQHIRTDTRKQPRPLEPVGPDPQVRVVCRAGGSILFSGAQPHSSVPNTSGRTRFSIDFRTVHIEDLLARRGVPNVDSAATGTSLRDFLRASDFAGLPNEIIAMHDTGDVPPGGTLVFEPPAVTRSE